MDQLKALKYFLATAETGNFTAAAKKLKVPASSVSRRIADLESSLSAQLLSRTTRTVALTEIGQQYFAQVKGLLELLDQCNQAVRDYQTRPTGKLKISSMVGFGETILIPILDEFSVLYPNVLLDVVLSDKVTKLGRDDVDIAIRGGFAPNERVMATKLLDNRFIAAASPDYLKEFGTPQSTIELKQHRGLYFKAPVGPNPWLSEIDGEWQDVSAPSVLTTNDGKWLIRKAIDGAGIVLMPRWVLQPYFNSAQLIELEFQEPLGITQRHDLGVYMLYQKTGYAIPKIRAAVDFITERVKEKY